MMGATAAVHPTDPILQAYGLGKLDDLSAESVSKHLELCESCRRRVAELSSDDFVDRLQQAQVKMDKATSGWSPSAASSSEGPASAFVPPPPAETLPPELVDNPDWEIIRELGRGGMGVVYLARNKLMGRQEVLKVVGRHLIERPGVLDRFLRDIQSAARLQHVNIVTAYSAIRIGSGLVLTMEYVKGYDLAKIVKAKGPLPIAHAAHFIHQAALGLQHAHERGMVHRDIKPANLMVGEGKRAVVKVLDFGLAKVTSEGEVDSNLTREGQMVGTPDYIAPEQIRDAKSADIRADIYSLGCTLYYLLSGGPPFRGDHLWDIYQAHFSMDAGPLNLVRPEVPVELAAVVAKMMAKEPGRRFQEPKDVAQALASFFKPTAAPFPGSDVASPKVTSLNPRTQTSAVNSAVAEPAAKTAPASAMQRAPKTVADGVAWESLIEIKDDRSLIVAPKRRALETKAVQAEEPTGRRRWIWPTVAMSTFVLMTFVAYCQIGLVVRTPEGDIVFDDLPEGAVVTVDTYVASIDWLGKKGSAKVTIPAGERTIKVELDGYQIYGENLTIAAGGNKRVSMHYKHGAYAESPPADSKGLRTEVLNTREFSQQNEAIEQVNPPLGNEIQAGTIWRGLADYEYPANYPHNYSVELTVTKRDGNEFEGVCKSDNARVVYEVQGTITGQKTLTRVIKPIIGLIDFADAPISGVISRERIDFELKHMTHDGRPALTKGYMTLMKD